MALPLELTKNIKVHSLKKEEGLPVNALGTSEAQNKIKIRNRMFKVGK